MVPLLQREALLKYCLEQYRNSNTKYQESVWLTLEYWQCNITIALQILRYLYCNIGIAYLLLNWMKLYKRRGQIHNTRKKKNLKKEKKWKIILDHVWGLPSPALVLESSLNAVSLLKHELNQLHELNIKIWLLWVFEWMASEHFHITGKGVNFAIHNCEYENLDKSFQGTGKEVRDFFPSNYAFHVPIL